jgi:oligopeptide transport system permease protein
VKRLLPALIPVFIIILLAAAGPLMSPYGYAEQHTALRNLPPRMPFIEKLGIMDGSAVLRNRRADGLEDPAQYPAGSVIKVLRRSDRAVPYTDVPHWLQHS